MNGKIMPELDRTAWEILNATADDWEDLKQIHGMIPREFGSLQEIANRIPALVEQGLLEARNCRDLGDCKLNNPDYVQHAWFAMTPQGRAVWQSQVPADLRS